MNKFKQQPLIILGDKVRLRLIQERDLFRILQVISMAIGRDSL